LGEKYFGYHPKLNDVFFIEVEIDGVSIPLF